MKLDDMLDRCSGLEARSASLYRSFAAAVRDQPDLSALWTAMAREEEDHASILDDIRRHLPTVEAWTTELSARWDEVVREVEEKLSAAEQVTGDADADHQLLAALELEMTEIEPLRRMLVARRPSTPAATRRGGARAPARRRGRAPQCPPGSSAASRTAASPRLSHRA